jgi:hypothetical protein
MAKMGAGSSGVFSDKKTLQGKGRCTKWPGPGSKTLGGGRVSKTYRKKYRGQGR